MPGATPLRRAGHALEQVAQLATRWFALFLDNSQEDPWKKPKETDDS